MACLIVTTLSGSHVRTPTQGGTKVTTPESWEGSPKANFPSRQCSSKVDDRTLVRSRLISPQPPIWRGNTSYPFARPYQVRSGNFKRNVSRLKVLYHSFVAQFVIIRPGNGSNSQHFWRISRVESTLPVDCVVKQNSHLRPGVVCSKTEPRNVEDR